MGLKEAEARVESYIGAAETSSDRPNLKYGGLKSSQEGSKAGPLRGRFVYSMESQVQ